MRRNHTEYSKEEFPKSCDLCWRIISDIGDMRKHMKSLFKKSYSISIYLLQFLCYRWLINICSCWNGSCGKLWKWTFGICLTGRKITLTSLRKCTCKTDPIVKYLLAYNLNKFENSRRHWVHVSGTTCLTVRNQNWLTFWKTTLLRQINSQGFKCLTIYYSRLF